MHHVQIKNLPFFQFDCDNKGEINADQPEQKSDLYFDDDHNNEKSKLIEDRNQTDQNSKLPNQKSINLSENLQIENDNKRRKIFLQFSEPVSKQTYNTNSGYYDEICLRRPIITMNFTDAISKKTTIYIKMFDSLTNKLIAELPLPLNIIPFDKKVSSKFRMINKFDEEKAINDKSSLNTDTNFSQKNIDFLEKAENESENNLIDFDILEKNENSNNIPKNIKVKKNVPKIKLFLLIHLSTFGQLPFHAQKGTLLKHLKDATRINAKSFGSKKDVKDKALSCNSIITPSPRASNQEISSSNSMPDQQKIKKIYDFEIFNSDKAKSTICKNSNSSSDYTESNDSSSEVVETLFVDNFSDQIIQNQQIHKEKQIQQTEVFIEDFAANLSHNHHHSHHKHHHRSSGRNHHHSHSKHSHSNQNNQLNQQKNASDDQNEVASYGQFNDKKHKNALLKVGSCGDIPAQCLLTDILVK